jgi:hypothetical protein
MQDTLSDRLRRGIKSVLQMALTLVVVLVIIAIGEALPPVRALDAYIREHKALEQTLLAVTYAMTIAGILLLALSQFLPAPRTPETMSRDELEALSPPMKYEETAWKRGGRLSRRIGGSFSGEASFASVKQAWRLRSWRYHRRWRLLFAMMLGAILLFFGLFGLMFMISSAGVKFLVLLGMMYVLVQSIRGFSRARVDPNP